MLGKIVRWFDRDQEDETNHRRERSELQSGDSEKTKMYLDDYVDSGKKFHPSQWLNVYEVDASGKAEFCYEVQAKDLDIEELVQGEWYAIEPTENGSDSYLAPQLPPVSPDFYDDPEAEELFDIDLTDRVNGKPVTAYPYWVNTKNWKAGTHPNLEDEDSWMEELWNELD